MSNNKQFLFVKQSVFHSLTNNSCLLNSQFSTRLTQDIVIELPFHYHILNNSKFQLGEQAVVAPASQTFVCFKCPLPFSDIEMLRVW